MAEDWIDISVPLYTGMVHWPDNPPVSIERMMDIDRGDTANVSKLSMGVHTGTHMDAPVHFFPGGKGIDTMPLAATIGLARVIEIHDPESIKPDELHMYQIKSGERILFKTRNSTRCWQSDDFVKDFVYISHEAAQYLAAQQVQTVGVDYLSVGGFFKDGVETHHALLSAGIWIIEGLNLSSVRAGTYELICLPLKIEGSDGAPSRAVLRLAGSAAT
ncbi:MAG TPA: arylformamidase [Ktedonobacter sp.]|jgi:arylformamidase|nr:arylformamidase [Ktedonobacter sp.]HAG98645.1 arylformamidase [Ktedonobacter sp.]HBE29750.1 arylformamidase [Ktedonobacter sp.]HCF88068.1 arylformamidase [Ktedonobacter sp.]HCJ34712.1 arylformamidase [Ktedonobacter sp.]